MEYKLIKGSANDAYDILGTVLRNRGIENPDDYITIDTRVCPNWESLDHIDEAIDCFEEHFINNDDITILVDCDPDGYTSAAMLYMYIKRMNPDYPVHYMIHKNNKAHGLGKMHEGDFKIPKGTKLLILPDSASNDLAEMNELMAKGIDIIVLDHHEVEPSDIKCNAIIVNNQISSNYTNKDFSGAGIVYEFLKGLDERFWNDYADDYLDLVALANISDLMDLRSFSTRYYVNLGLRNINNPMFQAFVQAQEYSIKGAVTPTAVAWSITPIINAMVRIGSFEERDLLFKAFVGEYQEFDYKKRSGEIIKETIYERAARLCKNAKGRQDKQRDKLFQSLVKKVDNNDKVVIVEADNTDSGIVGLVAMKLADYLKRCVVVLRDIGDDTLSGSLRNYDNSPVENLKELLNDTKLFHCQGHSNAAGAEIQRNDLPMAKSLLNDTLKDVVFDNTYLCDFMLPAECVDVRFVKEIDDCGWVWCTGIKEPNIAVTDIAVARKDIRVQGKDLNSIMFELDGIKYVAFKLQENHPLLVFANGWGDREDVIVFDAVVTCGINVYEGVSQCQCTIKDVVLTQQSD